MQGIRATVTISEPGGCPIAACSRETDAVIDQVSSSVALANSSGGVTEFLVPGPLPDDTDVEPVFDYGNATLVRTQHGETPECPCEHLGGLGCPVHRYEAREGEVTLVFHAASFDRLQTIMSLLREEYDSLDVRRLLQPPLSGSPAERVFVNRGKLTDRQLDVLTTAYEMGYFERPKRANASEVATELDIAQSTFTEHLVTAQRKLLEDILE